MQPSGDALADVVAFAAHSDDGGVQRPYALAQFGVLGVVVLNLDGADQARAFRGVGVVMQ